MLSFYYYFGDWGECCVAAGSEWITTYCGVIELETCLGHLLELHWSMYSETRPEFTKA